MNYSVVFMAFLAVVMAPVLGLAETKETLLSAGKYEVTFAPTVNGTTAEQIQKEVAAIPNVEDVKVDASASTIHFSVKNTQPPTVTLAQLRTSVSKVAPNEVLTTPYMQAPLSLP